MKVRHYILFFLLFLLGLVVVFKIQKTRGSITLESRTYHLKYTDLASLRAVTENTNDQIAISLKDCRPVDEDVKCKACMAYNSGSDVEYAVIAQSLEMVFASKRFKYRVSSIHTFEETFFNGCREFEHLPFCVEDYGPWNISLEAGQGYETFPDKPRWVSEREVRDFCMREGYIGPILLSK